MQIYYNTELPAGISVGQCLELSPGASHHLVVVLRYGVGQRVNICDGRGGLYGCKIAVANKKTAVVEVLEITENFGEEQQGVELHVAFALLKNQERMEWAVEKMVEIGAVTLTPIISARCERKSLNTTRLHKIAQSAAQQSLKGHLPTINEPVKIEEFLRQNPGGLIAHCQDPIAEKGKARIPAGLSKYTVLIGPEGDFTPQEVQNALDQNYTEITLGTARLRAETAAVCAAYQCKI